MSLPTFHTSPCLLFIDRVYNIEIKIDEKTLELVLKVKVEVR